MTEHNHTIRQGGRATRRPQRGPRRTKRKQQRRPRQTRKRTTRRTRGKDGLYHIGGEKFHNLKGSPRQVMYKDDNGVWSAYETAGGVNRSGLMYNSRGEIVSKARSKAARRNNNLGDNLAKKGSGQLAPQLKKHKKNN